MNQRRMRRRGLLAGIAAMMVLAGGGAGLTFRLHASPRREPGLTPDTMAKMLERVAQSPEGRRVLAIGNSALLRHDVMGHVTALAASEGVTIDPFVAAARGARLVETLRLPELRALLRAGSWDAVLVQDFSRSAERPWDRWGSEFAVRFIAGATAPAPVAILPHWPFAPDHPAYAARSSLRGLWQPGDPAAFARRSDAFWQGVARRTGAHLIDVSPAWLAALSAGRPLYAADRHHASPAGAALIAALIWETLADLWTPPGAGPDRQG